MADNQDILIHKKLRLLKIGLHGFIGGLILAFFSIVVQIVVSLWQAILRVENTGAWLSSLALALLPVFFAGAFVSFGLIVAAAVKEPRSADMGGLIKPSAGRIAFYFMAGVLLNTVPLLGTLAAFFGILYYRGGTMLFLALCYFVIAAMFFIVAAGIAIVRSAGEQAGDAQAAFAARGLFDALKSRALSGRSRRALTRVERALGSGLGAALYLLFTAHDLYEKAQSVTGHGSDRSWLDLLASADMILAIFSLFIFIFSTLFIIKAVKTAFDIHPADAGPSAPSGGA